MTIKAFQGLLGRLGAKIGLPELHADEDGYCALSFDDLPVHLQHDPEQDELLVFARLGPIRDDAWGPLAVELLAANLFWRDTGGATLGLQPEDGTVFLMERMAMAALDDARFEALLERFVAAAERWRETVAAYVHDPAADAAEAAGSERPVPNPHHLRA